MKGVLALCLFFVCALALDLSSLTAIASREGALPGRWIMLTTASDTDTVRFKILLKQRNLDQLDTLFWEVSNPQHANYGKYLTPNQLNALVAPEETVVRSVLEWVLASGISRSEVFAFPSFIQVVTSVKKASNLLHTPFAIYKSLKTQQTRTGINGVALIPTELDEHIDFIVGINELIDDTRIKPKQSKASTAADNNVTPAILRSYYGIPSTQVKNATQAIAAFTDYYSAGALKVFDTTYGIGLVNVNASGPNCLGSQTCDQYESDLDVQYVTALGYAAHTEFLAHAAGEWILDWALAVAQVSNTPLVQSISYGWAELEQCDITSDCANFSYTSQQYVTRTNTELQALGVRGITVLVSDGDDGAPSLGGASGNCPIDDSKYCPVGGCTHKTTSCGALTFTLESNNTVCFFPMGLGSDACAVVLADNSVVNAALDEFASKNRNCGLNLEADAENNDNVYSTCSCSALKVITKSGIKVAGYLFSQAAGAVFAADFPTSSPYVTSVGATQFTWNGNTPSGEIGASITTGAIITTGGGFSSFQAMPSYQTSAVSSYLSSGVALPPSFSFNPSMRAYPDVTFAGHKFNVYYSTNTNNLNVCPCTVNQFDGTSCASPSLAGLLTQVNDQLLAAGKPQLGFVNPLFYQAAAADSGIFNDITSGSNACNRAYCCLYGFNAAKGWDPVSGLGSPQFGKLLKYVLSQ